MLQLKIWIVSVFGLAWSSAALAQKESEPVLGHVSGSTISAEAAGETYHLYLPSRLCVLDAAEPTDARVLSDLRKQAEQIHEAAKKKRIEEKLKGGVGANTPVPSEDAVAAPSGNFAPCDQLRELRKTGEARALRTIGSATGTRRGKPDPSANAGTVYMAQFMCAMMSGDISSEKQRQTAEQKSERIARAWTESADGKRATLPAIEQHQLGCTSAHLYPVPGEGVVMIAHTIGMYFDWEFDFRTIAILKSQIQLIEELTEQRSMLDGIVKLNSRASSK